MVDNGRVEGIITPQVVKQLGRWEWSHTTVEDVMRPIAQVRTVDPMSSVTEALDVMSRDRATAKQLLTALAETLNGVEIDLQN